MGKDFDKSKANLYLSGFGGLTQRFKDPKLSDEVVSSKNIT